MKRICLALSLALMTIGLTSCGSGSGSASDKQLKELEQRITNLEFRLRTTNADLQRLRQCFYYAPSGQQALINLRFCK